MKNLITYGDISELARPCSTDREIAEALIAEAQRVDVKPRLGDALTLKLTEDTLEDPYALLLNGGVWEDCGGQHYLTGIKTALAYYALARITRDGNIRASTYGAVIKDDQYSAEAERTERQRQYRELFGQADIYMAEALNYLSKNCSEFPEYEVKRKMRNNRMAIRVIGK